MHLEEEVAGYKARACPLWFAQRSASLPTRLTQTIRVQLRRGPHYNIYMQLVTIVSPMLSALFEFEH